MVTWQQRQQQNRSPLMTPTAAYVWTSLRTLCYTNVDTCAYVTAVVDISCPGDPSVPCVALPSKTSYAPTEARKIDAAFIIIIMLPHQKD